MVRAAKLNGRWCCRCRRPWRSCKRSISSALQCQETLQTSPQQMQQARVRRPPSACSVPSSQCLVSHSHLTFSLHAWSCKFVTPSNTS